MEPSTQPQGPGASGAGRLGRGRRLAVRVLAVLGLVTLNFMIAFVISDAAGRGGQEPVLEPPGSVEAQIGADHPGETVHLVGALAALALGVLGLVGLIVGPDRAGSATHAGAAGVAWLLATATVGNPDNSGGQAGPVDVAFLVLVLPALTAVLVAAPWRAWRRGGLCRPRFLVLAGLGLPWVWHAVEQGLMQRNTWPPMADPHHQAHWFVMSLVAFMMVLVVAGGALAGHGWRVATITAGTAGLGVAVASLLAPEAASALHPAWAGAAGLWGATTLAVTLHGWRPVDEGAGAP